MVDAYNRVGANNTDASDSSPPAPTLEAGASSNADIDVFCCLANFARAFLTKENPFAWTPELRNADEHVAGLHRGRSWQ